MGKQSKTDNKLWYGHIPEIFGYGIMIISSSERKAKSGLKKAYYTLRKEYGSRTTYETAMENWGGGVYELFLDYVYYDNLNN